MNKIKAHTTENEANENGVRMMESREALVQ